MFRHSLTLAYRNFRRFKSTFLINLIGLSTALTCVLFIYLWVSHELQMDKFHAHEDNLYQIMVNSQNNSKMETWPGTPGLLADALESEISEVDFAVTGTDTDWFGAFTLTKEADYLKARGKFVSENYFKAFSYPLLFGDQEHILEGKNSIAISQSLATSMFGSPAAAMGETMNWQLGDITQEVLVSGVFENITDQSSDQFDFVLPFMFYEEEMVTYPFWNNSYAITYVVLQESASSEDFNAKIKDFMATKVPNAEATLLAVPFSSNYLYGKYENGKQAGGRIEYVRLFSLIAAFILIIACINFMNLSTAKASRRVKEVGIKKALGAKRSTLIFQYLGESLLMTIVSLLVAIFLVSLLLPQFNTIVGVDITLEFNLVFTLAIIGIMLLTGLIAGSYPALYLSRFNPAKTLKSLPALSGSESWARKGLVVFQFTLSIILMVAVLIVYQQIEFIQSKNLGFDKDNVLYLNKTGKVAEAPETFIQQAKELPGVLEAAQTNFRVGRTSYTYGVEWPGKTEDDDIAFYEITVGYDAVELLGLEFTKGRTFSRDFSSDSTAVIFNQAAISVMRMTDPIGQKISHYSGDKHIVGVVQDFNIESLYNEVHPLLIKFDPALTNSILVKIAAGREQETIAALQSLHQQYTSGVPMEYQFVDTDYQALYQAEQRVSTLSRYFAGFAILISCLGLFGLSAFTAERRMKEIGIRKILGSGEWSIIYLLSGHFTRMVLVATAIGLPLSYMAARYWLNGFAYQVELSVWYFAVVAILALLVAWLTVGLQLFKAARTNPVSCLHDD